MQYALPKNIARMQRDLEKYRIHYDRWFLESTLHEDGELNEVVEILKNKGLTYEKEGALWYRATDFGAEKDEVLIRQNGNPTYFTADIAYHRNKFNRGFTRLIDVWGADHHLSLIHIYGGGKLTGLLVLFGSGSLFLSSSLLLSVCHSLSLRPDYFVSL